MQIKSDNLTWKIFILPENVSLKSLDRIAWNDFLRQPSSSAGAICFRNFRRDFLLTRSNPNDAGTCWQMLNATNLYFSADVIDNQTNRFKTCDNDKSKLEHAFLFQKNKKCKRDASNGKIIILMKSFNIKNITKSNIIYKFIPIVYDSETATKY